MLHSQDLSMNSYTNVGGYISSFNIAVKAQNQSFLAKLVIYGFITFRDVAETEKKTTRLGQYTVMSWRYLVARCKWIITPKSSL